MARLVEPRTLKGFRDYPPDLMIPRERLMEAARNVFRSYGFNPIDTPALEYAEVLLAKVEDGAEIGKQLFRFQDAGGRDVALRFDLTVPLARFVSQHVASLGLPFKRYHLAPVWRGENPQAGRYREFAQCDFDTIGSTSVAADAEIALVICDLFAALGVDHYEVRVNNRLVLNELLVSLGLPTEAITPVLRALDKLPKIGPAAVRAELTAEGGTGAGATVAQADAVIALASTTGTNTSILASLDAQFPASPGVAALRELAGIVHTAGIPDGKVKIDLAICRGLDYYTGTVYETFLTDLPGIGSVCSGGRYDDLTGRYTKQSLPGVGASLGLDRLLAALEQLGRLDGASTAAPVLIARFDGARTGEYQHLARRLRAAGVGTEVYPDAKKLGLQLQYAERKGFALAIIAGPEEFASGTWKIKHLAGRTETSVLDADIVASVQQALE